METFGLNHPLCDYNDSMDALPELNWESTALYSPITADLREDTNLQQQQVWPTIFDDDDQDLGDQDQDQPLVMLRDRLITDASMLDLLPGNYTTKDSSRSVAKGSPLLGSSSSPFCSSSAYAAAKDDADTNDDIKFNHEMAGDFCDPVTLNIKSENCDEAIRPGEKRKRVNVPRIRDVTKMKAIASDCDEGLARMSHNNINNGRFMLPPTPPSSTSSDSEGSVSPLRDVISPKLEPEEMIVIDVNRRIVQNGRVLALGKASGSSSSCSSSSDSFTSVSNRHPINSPLISYQPKGSTGILQLTEEEKRTLLAEGYPVPTRLPLTKAEEKSLKKIRRKIKNKISAQESRRKKKEYMDTLERRATILADENHDYRQRLHQLEADNMTLQLQLNRFHELLNQSDIQFHLNDESPSPVTLPKTISSEGCSGISAL